MNHKKSRKKMPADLQTFRKNFTFTKGLWTIGPLLPQSPSPFLRPSSPVPVPGSFFYTIPPPVHTLRLA